MMAYVGLDRGADLGSYALVGAQQRHVAVRGAAGDDLDQAGVIEVTESRDDVAVERAKVIESLRKEAMPEAGGLGQVGFAGLNKVRLILARGDDLAPEIIRKLGDEAWVRELFQQNGREIQVALKSNAVSLKISQHPQQWKVGLGSSFVEPLHSVWPRAVIDDIRQVRMQGKGEVACRAFRCIG